MVEEKSIPDLVKDPNKLFLEVNDVDSIWIAYPHDIDGHDNPWYLCKTLSREDAEFIKDAIALHCSNFIHKDE